MDNKIIVEIIAPVDHTVNVHMKLGGNRWRYDITKNGKWKVYAQCSAVHISFV